ncbi:MAG: hypothetical protein ABSA77_04420 [Thermoguttaceae bacterium]|jgi:hypothetical protein
MARIWSLFWLAAAVGGVALMALAYRQAQNSLGSGGNRHVLYVAKQPGAKAEKGSPVVVYFLPAGETVETLAKGLGGIDSEQGKSFLRNHQQMVILLPDFKQRFAENMLESGRLPEPGTKEVLADPHTSSRDRIIVGNEKLTVVGVLKKTNSLHLDACYAADDPAMRNMLEKNGKTLAGGYLISSDDLKKIEDVKKQFPRKELTAISALDRMKKAAYYNYALGELLFLLGGSGLLIKGYMFAARRITNAWIGAPLAEINRHWKLFSLMHAVYFGLFLIGMLAIYEAPLLQDFLLAAISGQIENKTGVLGVLGTVYESRNIALAAVVTLLVNFFVGSLLVITLPSVIVPGIGVFMAVFRATLWGLLLAPSYMALAGGEIFHSGTLLLEGEGYILAAFFALLVPIYLFSPKEGENVGTRYARAVLMNLKGNIIVFIMLAIAAAYEAIEVILQMR